jgi:hypothetical protein
MISSTPETHVVPATSVQISDDTIALTLADGRVISVPLGWYPRLAHAQPSERQKWRLIGNGQGIHWPDLDEDISVEALLAGRASAESQRSLKRWLEQRIDQ